MEKLEHVGRRQEAANESFAVLREMAQVEFENLLASAKYQSLETAAEKAGYLRGLVLEYGAAVDDTNVPVDNSKRFIVDLLAFELWKMEQEESVAAAGLAEERMSMVR